MVFNIIVTLFVVVVIAFIVNLFNDKIQNTHNSTSFKEPLDLINLPVVTFKEGDRELNFLIDSGSTESHISNSESQKMLGTPIVNEYTYIGSTGVAGLTSKIINSTLEHDNKKFNINLIINNSLDVSFDAIKDKEGFQLHGILGVDFLKKYKCTIDFNKYTLNYSLK